MHRCSRRDQSYHLGCPGKLQLSCFRTIFTDFIMMKYHVRPARMQYLRSSNQPDQ